MQALATRHTASRPAAPTRSSAVVVRAAGFGKSNKKIEQSGSAGSYNAPQSKKRFDLKDLKDLDAEKEKPSTSKSTSEPVNLGKGNWFELATLADFGDKSKKLCELKGSKQFVLLHSYKGAVYAMDAYSTAFQYPLIDATIVDGADGAPMIETPLDGTQYDLKTGKVIRWCPKDNPIRSLLGTLKSAVDPVPLPVYPVVVKPEGQIMVRMS